MIIACGTTRTQDPRMTDVPCVGAVVFGHDGRLLLVRRAGTPAQGTWSIPADASRPASPTSRRCCARRPRTGLAGVVERLAGVVTRDAPSGDTYVIRDFVVQVTGDAVPHAGDDAAGVAWLPAWTWLPLRPGPG